MVQGMQLQDQFLSGLLHVVNPENAKRNVADEILFSSRQLT